MPTRTLTIKNTKDNEGKPVLNLADTPHYSEDINSAMDADLGGNAASTNQINSYQPLVISSVGDVYKADFPSNTNVLTFTLKNVQGDWIQKFDTGIKYSEYDLALLSYSLILPEVDTVNGMVTMLENSNDIFDTYNPTKENMGSVSRYAVPSVQVVNSEGNWVIKADYVSADPKIFKAGEKQPGTTANITWKITVLVGKKNNSNIGEINFDMEQTPSMNGLDNTDYQTQINAYLDKIK